MAHYIPSVLGLGLPGNSEWLLILFVALLIFGRRLPEIARNMGKSMTEFKRGLKDAQDVKDDVDNSIKEVKSHTVNQAKEAAGLNEQDRES